MINPSIAVRHVKLEREEACGVCSARFVAAEDSGSRVLLIRLADDTFTGLMCGGCASKWAYGTITAAFKSSVTL
ncbi:MAG: hypothetical protein M3R55_07150 [Acidobacteriota bacterium]|nr:hypothetical protein [Acidobacteriota bacterium]